MIPPQEERRGFLKRVLAIVPASTVTVAAGVSQTACSDKAPAPNEQTTSAKYLPSYLNDAEWAFVHAAVALLIPADEHGPGAVEAGVPEFIDRQLEMPYGHGKLWYMQGPFHTDQRPELGYQLNMTPRDIYRHGIADCDDWCKKNHDGKTFAELSKEVQTEVLKALEGGKIELANTPAKVLFTYLLNNSREGFLADPIYGGNKGMVGWKLVGFPGARADFMDWVDMPNKTYPYGPVSISGENA